MPLYNTDFKEVLIKGEEKILAGDKLSGHLFHTNLSIFWLKNLHLDLDDNSGGCMVEVLINECSLCSMMEDVKVNIGELFQDLEH